MRSFCYFVKLEKKLTTFISFHFLEGQSSSSSVSQGTDTDTSSSKRGRESINDKIAAYPVIADSYRTYFTDTYQLVDTEADFLHHLYQSTKQCDMMLFECYVVEHFHILEHLDWTRIREGKEPFSLFLIVHHTDYQWVILFEIH